MENNVSTNGVDEIQHNSSEEGSLEDIAKGIHSKLNLLKNSPPPLTRDCFIFYVPNKLREENSHFYCSRSVVIGPVGLYRSVGQDMEKQKGRYLASFLERVEESSSLTLNDFCKLINDDLAKIRGCFERTCCREFHSPDQARQTLQVNESDSWRLIEMLLLDSGFIIELFLRAYSKEWRSQNDFVFGKSGMFLLDLRHDLILVQNQLPFFLLRNIYGLAFSSNPKFPSFIDLTYHFFSHYYNQNISIEDILSPNNREYVDYRSMLEGPKHFLDLVRTFQLPPHLFQMQNNNEESLRCKWIHRKVKSLMDLIRSSLQRYSSRKPGENKPELNLEEGNVQGEYLYSAILLLEAGVKFKVSSKKCLLDIEFIESNGELKIPPFSVDDSTELFYRNLMFWEQCYYPQDTYICNYIFLMEYLVKSAEDVDLLVRRRIIINQLGSHKAVVSLFNKLCKHIKVNKNHYSELFKKLNAYNAVRHHSWIAILKLQYFSSLWRGVATVAAVILLVLTLIQTICAVISL
ncbi:hypothetical protein SCA6_018030 [Theobroma cacao]